MDIQSSIRRSKVYRTLSAYYSRLYTNTIKLTDLQNIISVINTLGEVFETQAKPEDKQQKRRKGLMNFSLGLLRFVGGAQVTIKKEKTPITPIHILLNIPSLILFGLKLAINTSIDTIAYTFNAKMQGKAYTQNNDMQGFNSHYYGKRSTVAAVIKLLISWILLIEPLRLLWQALVVAPFVAAYESNKFGAYLGVVFIIAFFIALSFTTFGVGGLLALPALTNATSLIASTYYASIIHYGAIALITGGLLTLSVSFFTGLANASSYLAEKIAVYIKFILPKHTKTIEAAEVVTGNSSTFSIHRATTQSSPKRSLTATERLDPTAVGVDIPVELEMVPSVATTQEPASSVSNDSREKTDVKEESTWYSRTLDALKAHPYIAFGFGVVGFKVAGTLVGTVMVIKAMSATAFALKLSGAALSAYTSTWLNQTSKSEQLYSKLFKAKALDQAKEEDATQSVTLRNG